MQHFAKMPYESIVSSNLTSTAITYDMKYINSGHSGNVYAYNNVAIKVGDISLFEAIRQIHFADKGLAPHVYFYKANTKISPLVAKGLCYIHGKRKHWQKHSICTCHLEYADILIMELVEVNFDNIHTPEIDTLIKLVTDESIALFNSPRDTRAINTGILHDRLVVLDFG